MKVTWVINEKLQLILTPSDEKDEALLKQLSQNEIELRIMDKVQTGIDSHSNAGVITTKTPTS